MSADPQGDSWVDPQLSDNIMTKLMINNRKDARKTEINFLNWLSEGLIEETNKHLSK